MRLCWRLVVATLVLSLVQASLVCAEYPPDIAKVLDRGRLIVAMYYEDIPPFFFHDKEGHFTGQDVDMAQGMAEALGVGLEFDRRAQSFSEIVDIVSRGEADMAISQLSRTLERAKRVIYSRPYVVLKLGLLINRLQQEKLRKTQDGPLDLMKLFNQPKAVVAVRAETSYVPFAREIFPQATIKLYPDWAPTAVGAVISGEASVGLTDETELKKYILDRPEAAIHVKTAVIDYLNDPIAIALPPGSQQLRDWVNLYLDERVPRLDADILLDKYLKLGVSAK